MSSRMLIVVWNHSRARGLAYALLQAIADCMGGDGVSRQANLRDEWLIDWVRMTPKQFERARAQLRRIGELEYWPTEEEGHTHYRIPHLPGEREGAH